MFSELNLQFVVSFSIHWIGYRINVCEQVPLEKCGISLKVPLEKCSVSPKVPLEKCGVSPKVPLHTFVYYYSNENSTMEIDFVVQHDNDVIPVEVKAEENLRAKSLRQFTSDNPGLHGMRFSMSGYREQEWMTNVPLWAVSGRLRNLTVI